MSFRLGLTGSIGMGKSTTAALFAEQGAKVWDADAAVHRLYARGGGAVAPLGRLFPQAVRDGGIDRPALRSIIQDDPNALKEIEKIVHPLVAEDRADFARRHSKEICVFDIPLLFEGGGHAEMDAVACVFVAPELQRQRVLDRGTMSPEQFEQILARQMPIDEKLERSDYRIETDTLEHARAQVHTVLRDIRKRIGHA